MEDQYISFETAILAKEKGFSFDVDLDDYIDNGGLMFFGQNYKNKNYKLPLSLLFWHTSPNTQQWVDLNLPCPTQSLLKKWLRDKYNIDIVVYPVQMKINDKIIEQFSNIEYSYYFFKNGIQFDVFDNPDTYEKILEKGLIKALNLI